MKVLIISLAIFVFSTVAEAKTWKTLNQNFVKGKSKLVRLFEMSGIDYPEALLSDSRLKLHPEIWARYPSFPSTLMLYDSIERGKTVISDNIDFLRDVERKYGVPKEILISIFRVETNLGRFTGNYTVFNSLLTWTFSGTKRWKWAESELVTFVRMCQRNGIDPFEVPSSTHGAFGLTQFIPSSYVRWAIAKDNSRRPDLFIFEDAILSSANYLEANGWRRNQRKSLYAYNASTPYVNSVVRYAKAIKMTDYEIETRRKYETNETENAKEEI